MRENNNKSRIFLTGEFAVRSQLSLCVSFYPDLGLTE